MTKAKELCEKICLNYTRGMLENTAKKIGYKNVGKIPRSRLEQIVYVNEMCGDIACDNFCIVNYVTGDTLVKCCGRKYMIDWIIRNCLFNWYEEQEQPVTRDGLHHEIRVTAFKMRDVNLRPQKKE